MITSPKSYYDWKIALDKFAAGDDSVLQLMNEGEMILDAGTATRFLGLIDSAYKKRKQLWIDKFNGLLKNQVIRKTSEFGIVINQAKMGLRTLIQFTQIPAFSNDIKKMLNDDLEQYVNQIRKSLKEDSYKNRSNETQSLLLIFDNLEIKKVVVNSIPTGTNESTQTNLPGKRRIIF